MPKLDFKKILIVDDEPDLCDLLKFEVENLGYESAIAASGDKAIKLLRTFPAFLILSDINMPNVDGIQLLEFVLKIPHPRPTVILCTGFQGYDPEILKKKGAMEVLEKPYDFRRLKALIAELSKERKNETG